MGLFNLISGLCMVITFLLSASDHGNAQRSLRQYGGHTMHYARRLTLQPLSLLRMHEVEQDPLLKSFVNQMNSGPNRKLLIHSPSDNKQEEKVMAINHHHQQIGTGGKGTWREWIESPNKSDFFTMDYHWVRRRRPIHNKHLSLPP